MKACPTPQEMGAAYALGERLRARMPHVTHAALLDYLHWTADLLERLAAHEPSVQARRAIRRDLCVLRAAQQRIAAGTHEEARQVVRAFDADLRRQLNAGGRRGW